MTAQRLIQNFKQSRGVLLSGADLATETFEKTLAKLGVATVRFEDIEVASLDHNRDILFIDGDHVFNPALLLRVGSSLPVAPVVGIVGVEAPSRLKLLAEAGATAFLRKPIHASAVYSALFLGVNNYRRLHAMELRLIDHDRRRHGRRFVVKAVTALMQARSVTDDEAYAQLRHESMRQRRGIEEFCEHILEQGDFPAAWPLPRATAGTLPQARENGDETHFDDDCRRLGNVDTAIGQSGGSDKARRA
jgi:AmiR/NasT family two-component response regulator